MDGSSAIAPLKQIEPVVKTQPIAATLWPKPPKGLPPIGPLECEYLEVALPDPVSRRLCAIVGR